MPIIVEALAEALKDSSRPSFLFGSTPPLASTDTEKAKRVCARFAARSAVLATDGFIVYDIQDEEGRTTMERPFPFRKLMDASTYATYFRNTTGKQCVVYKCVVEDSISQFQEWLDRAVDEHGHNSFTLVGAPTSSKQYKGPSLIEGGAVVKAKRGCNFGCVCIAERHTKKGNEHLNMQRKVDAGAQWFITQGIFHAEPLIELLHKYGDHCRQKGITPKKVIMTFAPCGREKTMKFIKWLGMSVPEEVEQRILNADNPVDESCILLNELLVKILEQSAGSGVPLGINVESLSIFKEEINGAARLFQTLQATLLNSRGSPWSVRWFCVERLLSVQSSSASEASLVAMEKRAKEMKIERDAENLMRDNELSASRGGIDTATVAAIAIASLLGGIFIGKSVR